MVTASSSAVTKADRPKGNSGTSGICPYCGKVFAHSKNIKRHIETACKKVPKGDSFDKRMPPLQFQLQSNYEAICPHCNHHLKQARNLPRHLSSCPAANVALQASSINSGGHTFHKRPVTRSQTIQSFHVPATHTASSSRDMNRSGLSETPASLHEGLLFSPSQSTLPHESQHSQHSAEGGVNGQVPFHCDAKFYDKNDFPHLR